MKIKKEDIEMARMVIDPNRKLSRINREIYGHLSEHLGRCIYEGIYVGKDSPVENVNGMRSDVVEALKQIRVPVLRWPGGCFADEYHWMDGIGPAGARKWLRITVSVPTNILNSAGSLDARLILTGTWEAER